MSGTTISTHLTTSVVVGSPGYGGPITITTTGLVVPSIAGATGIEIPLGTANPTIVNQGAIAGGAGSYGPGPSNGGTGIVILAGTLINSGVVEGGHGGQTYHGSQGVSGGGVMAGSGVLVVNTGTINGGDSGEDFAGNATDNETSGYGVSLGTNAILKNYGTVASGGRLDVYASGGNGGTAVLGQQASIYNYGKIVGYQGGQDSDTFYASTGNGGDGVMLAGGSLLNDGSIIGGDGGNDIVKYYPFDAGGGNGGFGVSLVGTFANLTDGIVKGGYGGTGAYGGYGGDGVILTGSGFNLGVIAAGSAGHSYNNIVPSSPHAGDGGVGLQFSDGVFDNAGTITGGASDVSEFVPVEPGDGVSGGSGSTLINTGFIEGGGAGISYGAVQGAAGVVAAMVSNTGFIKGGQGGLTEAYGIEGRTGGNGGVGVEADFVVNSGTIEGGAGGRGNTADGAEGDAVDAGTLVVDPGAVFIGNVNVSTLEVAGTSALALSGFGTQFDASQAIIFDAGSHWSVEGDVAGFTGRAIEGFAGGDAIMLDGVSVASETFQTGVGLELSIGGSEVTLAIAGNFDTADFSVTNAGNATIILASSLTTGTPELAVPGSQNLTAGAAKKITGMTLSETPTAPGETFTVILSDSYGLLSATGSGISGSGTTMLTLSGSLAQVNADLATLKDTDYTAAPDTITVTATDSLGGVATVKTIAIAVNGTIGPGKYIAVPKGVNAGSLTVTHTGVELVQSGGSASSTALSAHGLQLVIGAANTTQIESGGYQIVGPKGASSGTTIGQGGYEIVSAGGRAIDTTIATGGTMLLTDGALSSGVIGFAGSNGELLIGGTALPTTVIDGFNLNGATGDAIVLAGSTYDAGHDTVSLSSGNVLNLDLNGKIEKLFLNPTQNFAGHLFTLSANSFGQVVITDPLTGTAAVKAGLLSPSKNLAALDNALLNTKAFATLPSVGMSADLMFFAGIGFLPALETVPFFVRGANLAAIGSFSSTH